MTWRKTLIIILTLLVNLLPVRTVVTAELQPVVGVTLFGGAERGDNERAGGIGGAELLGLYPLGPNFGFKAVC
ncbi:MAG TPA: hypothetical protein VMT22_07445 [Terriglobales bacterium]|nr:hypothetical protein [Terriglobales bacterium]